MNCYYDRKDFMVGHVFFEYYKYYISMPHLRGVWEEKKKVLVNPDLLGEHPNYL